MAQEHYDFLLCRTQTHSEVVSEQLWTYKGVFWCLTFFLQTDLSWGIPCRIRLLSQRNGITVSLSSLLHLQYAMLHQSNLRPFLPLLHHLRTPLWIPGERTVQLDLTNFYEITQVMRWPPVYPLILYIITNTNIFRRLYPCKYKKLETSVGTSLITNSLQEIDLKNNIFFNKLLS